MSKQNEAQDQGVGWIYQNPNEFTNESSLDDFLLGNKRISDIKPTETHKRTNTALENLSKIKQDPLLAIQTAQLSQLKAILEKKKLMQKIEESDKEKRKREKRERKERKREKKERKKEKKRERESNDEEHRKKRKREGSEEEQDHKHEEKKRRRNDDDHYSRSDRYSDRSEDRYRRRDDRYEDYRGSSSHSSSSSGYRRDYRNDRSRGYSKQLSAEEQNRKLQEMLQDGQSREQQKMASIQKGEAAKRDQHEMELPRDKHHASFLYKARREAYLDSGHTLEDRVSRNMFRVQKDPSQHEE